MPVRPPDERDRTLSRPDGRTLGWASYGDPSGRPVVALHGSARAVVDWPVDLERLADHLDLGRFPVVAISGGGAYALASAWKLGARVSGVALFSVIGPPPEDRAIMQRPDVPGPVHLWQGGRDDVLTPAMARYLHERLSGSVLHFEPEYSTFTFLDHLDPMLEVLAPWTTS
jgi:pimeloyl-ACP methyl ester carboxylesterase